MQYKGICSLTKYYILVFFNICDYMYLKSFCHSCEWKAVRKCKSYIRLLILNVIITMFTVSSNKCIYTLVLFLFFSWVLLLLSILSPPTCTPPPPKLVFRVSGRSRHFDILQALDVRLRVSQSCIYGIVFTMTDLLKCVQLLTVVRVHLSWHFYFVKG